MNLNVFRTRRDYVNPANHLTDLVYLDEYMNPLHEMGVDIALKALCHDAQTGKMIPIFHILEEMEKNGELKGAHTAVIPSSGNAAKEAAQAAGIFGIRRVVAVVPDNIPQGKLTQLRMSGAEVVFAKGRNPVKVAEKLGRRKGWVYIAQYHDRLNPMGHALVTGTQIVRQAENLGAVCVPMGTSGAKEGIRIALQEHDLTHVQVWGVATYPGESISGMKTRKGLQEEVGLNWGELDELYEVRAHYAAFTALRLYQGSWPGGLTAGAAVWAALSIGHRILLKGSWRRLFSKISGRALIVVPAVDTIVQYWDEVERGLSDEEKERQPMVLPPPAAAA